MQALQLTQTGHEAEMRDVPQPEPAPGEVLVEVLGAGAGHSDLHLMETELAPELVPHELPFTLGHENAGRVAALGEGVSSDAPNSLDVGQPVLVYGPWGCGRCHRCRQGIENYCQHAEEIGAAGGGLGRDGGMASHMVVPDPRLLVPLGDLDPRDAAPLADAALTPYHAIKRALPRLQPGSHAVVIGIGGLGTAAVALLRQLTAATIIAVDLDEARLHSAKALGADHGVVSDDDAAEEIRGITGGVGADVVLDVVGNGATMPLGAAVGRRLSELTIVGLGGGTLEVDPQVLPFETSVAGTYWGTLPELMEVVSLAQQGRLTLPTERFALDDALDVYHRLSAGEIEGRAVITPNG